MDNNLPSSEELISLSQAAEMSGLSPSYMRRLVSKGEIWGMKIGRNWVTTGKAVQVFIVRDRKPGPKPKNNTP